MNRTIIVLILSIILISCSSKKNEIKVLNQKEIIIDSISILKNQYEELDKIYSENKEKRDSIRALFWELCPKYFNLLKKLSNINKPLNDSILKALISKSGELNQNQLLLNAIIENRLDTTLITIEKPISPIFQLLENSLGIYNSTEYKSGDKNLLAKTDYNKRLLQSENISSMMGKLTSYENVINSLYKNGKNINLYSTIKKHKASIKSFGFKDDECTPYFFYECKLKDKSDENEYFLFASNYNIDITYNNHSKIDILINNQYPNICADCPSSFNFQKTFAKLNGFEDIYFTYAIEQNSEIDKTSTPLRSLVYIKNENIVYLWSSKIDTFGCSCL